MKNQPVLKGDTVHSTASGRGPMRSICFALAFALLIALLPAFASAQEFDLQLPAAATDASTPAVLRDLAERVLPVYQESDRERYLANLAALQFVSGGFAAAYATRQELRQWRHSAHGVWPADRSVMYDIYTHARAIEAEGQLQFAAALAQSFQDVVPGLNDAEAYAITWHFQAPAPEPLEALQGLFDRLRPKGSVTLPEAVDLIWAYFSFTAYQQLHPLIDPLVAADYSRRYTTESGVLIRTRDGATISATVVRPRSAANKLPALLEFTIYVYPGNNAMECAAHGYVGVIAYTRGKDRSPDKPVPFEHDGDDARAVINWIARQPWSDGRVGMYGEDYSAFTQWAAAKHLPPALKAIATSAATAPGINLTRQGGIPVNAAYRWVRFVTDNKTLDEAIYRDDAHWQRLDQSWYASGKPYWDLAQIYGTPNANFRRWLGHPSYDGYWQNMIPYHEEFAHINIPVLTTTGYYDSNEAGALYYLTEHYRYDSKADQTLLIGPYDQVAIERGPLKVLQGYQVDSAALIDLRELRYQWFDAIFKGGARPALLQDRINYQVMGANTWEHAPSLAAMANGSMRFYLDSGPSSDNNRLVATLRSSSAFARQSVDLADRSDAAWSAASELISRDVPSHNQLTFVSEPLAQPMEINGLFSGLLDFTVNKMDMDITIALYEQLASGDYIRLFDPPYTFRASYAQDRSRRRLLKAGERQQLAFRSDRLTSRKLQAGSRLVMLLGINKRPDQQINYGTGGDVSDESVADAALPLKIRWYGSSYIDIPVRR
jgi:putative CocE/NonD family hydrolase